MTREEAASIIEERVRVTEYVESSYVDCVDIEALRLAIKALEQPEILACGEGELITQPERKTGRWIDEGQYADFFPHHAFCCSECGHHLLEIEVVYDYCPFCGAKMEVEND